MAAFLNALFAAGPLAGWLSAVTLFALFSWAILRDWVILKGRHLEQRDHYEQVLAQTHAAHTGRADDLRRHMQALIDQVAERLAKAEEDRNYWRDTALDAMNALAASVGRSDDA